MTKEKLIKLRCKAWGITEDEYYCNQCGDFSLEDMAKAYRRGKNRSRERIAELETQIKKMKCCGNCKGVCNSDDVAYFCKSNDYKLWEIKENE